MTTHLTHEQCERLHWHDFKHEHVVNVTVKNFAYRKQPSTPEFIAMCDNIDRVEKLPPVADDSIKRLVAEARKRLQEKMEESVRFRSFLQEPASEFVIHPVRRRRKWIS